MKIELQYCIPHERILLTHEVVGSGPDMQSAADAMRADLEIQIKALLDAVQPKRNIGTK